ncbi:MAG: phage holin family protein [Alistipes sp.]|nr:phage holin family protein [Alistipes sp.]
MEGLFRFFKCIVVTLLSLFAPVKSVICCTLCFVLIDFVTGVAASRAMAKREGRVWYFESREAWRTLYKGGFVVMAIGMMWILESCVLDFMTLNLTKLLAGFICSVEMWSFLENAAQLSDAPLFEWMRRYLHRRIERQVEDVK